MKEVALADVKDHLSECLRDAEKTEIVITRHGKPAGVLIGFATEDDWLDYRLENDPRFLERIARARASLRAGQGIPWPEVDAGDEPADAFKASDKPRTRRR
jgi:prevent-host-death family protein